ncbi:hypothetical protein HK101_010751, partial [Irineochytrium annulatum]
MNGSDCYVAQIMNCDNIPFIVPFTRSFAILCWISAATGLVAVVTRAIRRRREATVQGAVSGRSAILSQFELSMVLMTADSAMTALQLTISAFVNVTSVVFNNRRTEQLLKANPHPTARVNNFRILWLRLLVIPLLLLCAAHIYAGYQIDRVHYDDRSDNGVKMLGIANTVDVVIWFAICIWLLAVIHFPKKELYERLRDIANDKPLFDAQLGTATGTRLLPVMKLESTPEPFLCKRISQCVTVTEERLAASLKGAIWTLTVMWWTVLAYLVYSALFAIATLTIGYPQWIYFCLVAFMYASSATTSMAPAMNSSSDCYF